MAVFDSLSQSSLSSFVSFSFVSLIFVLGGFLFLAYRPQISSKSPGITARDWPIVGDLRFFTKRFDFFRDAVANSVSGNFSFHVGKHHVVGLSGPKGRYTFFESRQLDFSSGYSMLFGVPNLDQVEDEDGNITDKFSLHFSKRIISMLKRDNLTTGLDSMMRDSHAMLDALAASPEKCTNPFDSVYKLVYQLTMRTVGVADIADDPALLAKSLSLYETFEASSTATGIIFPWLPTPAKIKRTWAIGRLYMIFKAVVDKRKATGERKDDPLQFQIDQGDSMTQIIQFIIGALFAGLLNSGINSAAILCYLATSPQWKAAVLHELHTVAATHCPSSLSSAPLVDQLSALPLEVWEKEFPLLDACLKESIRLQMPGAALRRNTSGKDVLVGDERIPNGAFAAYHVTDTHHDPTIFPSPTSFDPGRFLPDRAEDKKQPYAYMGWGLGRHPCLGMKFAKLESNIITALFLAKFDFDLVDARGKPTGVPEPDLNAWAAGKPGVLVFLKLRLRE